MKKIAPGLVLLLVAACNSTGRMELPPTTGAAYFDVDPTYLKSITFDRTVYRIPRGTVIGHFPHFSVGVGDPEVTGNLCNNRHAPPSLLEWSGSSRELHGWSSETGEVFFDVLSARGFPFAAETRRCRHCTKGFCDRVALAPILEEYCFGRDCQCFAAL